MFNNNNMHMEIPTLRVFMDEAMPTAPQSLDSQQNIVSQVYNK